MNRFLSSVLLAPLLLSCAPDKTLDKGVVDESTPPGVPGGLGKADHTSQLLAIDVQSEHPYQNDMNEEYTIELGDIVPYCASRVRLRFPVFQLESGYDFLSVVDAFGNIVETASGNHDGEYSEWLELGETARSVSLVLESDYSVTRHGFEVDGVEWTGGPICPLFVPSCPEGEVDVNPAPGACECPALPTCVAIEDLAASHSTGGGFTGGVTGTRIEGDTAISFASITATSPLVETVLGTVDAGALFGLFRAAAHSGVLHGPGVSEPSNWTESFTLQAGSIQSHYARNAGSYPDNEAEIIARYDALFQCGPGNALTCGAGQLCDNGSCVADVGCLCPEIAAPVCGNNGITYGNSCEAACANVSIKHEGLCGITGDPCDGILGQSCQSGYKCRFGAGQFEAPFPDASGLCVGEGYCDAPADCSSLPHIAVPGQWACMSNSCQWQVGNPWTAMDWEMQTSHPYGNNVSVWKQLYAPASAASVRVEIDGLFALEDGYDYLEVWSWNGQNWFRELRLTGSEAAGTSYEFGGRYHYLHFVSDVSVVDHGFTLRASHSSMEI